MSLLRRWKILQRLSYLCSYLISIFKIVMQYQNHPFDPHISMLHLKPIIRMTDFLDNASLFNHFRI